MLKAIEKQVLTLKNKAPNKEVKQLAFKVLVHLMGDLHQPMHMGHKTDLGGNLFAR